jgi:hypothetical protein
MASSTPNSVLDMNGSVLKSMQNIVTPNAHISFLHPENTSISANDGDTTTYDHMIQERRNESYLLNS